MSVDCEALATHIVKYRHDYGYIGIHHAKLFCRVHSELEMHRCGGEMVPITIEMEEN